MRCHCQSSGRSYTNAIEPANQPCPFGMYSMLPLAEPLQASLTGKVESVLTLHKCAGLGSTSRRVCQSIFVIHQFQCHRLYRSGQLRFRRYLQWRIWKKAAWKPRVCRGSCRTPSVSVLADDLCPKVRITRIAAMQE